MVLFPIALLWLVCVIVWVVRNEAKPEGERRVDWRRWRPRPPRRPTGSRSGGAQARAARPARRESRQEAATPPADAPRRTV